MLVSIELECFNVLTRWFVVVQLKSHQRIFFRRKIKEINIRPHTVATVVDRKMLPRTTNTDALNHLIKFNLNAKGSRF